jgi:uncharacterized membrane protein YphA (DoxX/SURF4 family)
MTLRSWLGFKKAKIWHVPTWSLKFISIFTNFIPYSTFNSDAIKMLLKNNITDAAEAHKFQDAIRFTPQDYVTGVYQHPSQSQDRWHAILMLFKPIIRLALALMWFMSAVTSAFIYPTDQSLNLLSQVGIPADLQRFFLYSACVLNFLIGVALLFNYKSKLNYSIQLLVITIYTLIITFFLPSLWWEPFGPIVKNIPIFITILLMLNLERVK